MIVCKASQNNETGFGFRVENSNSRADGPAQPGEFMRGRVTYGCYQAMGVTDLIAKDEHDYVEIATRLAHDTAWRERMQEHIRERSAVLFENTAVIDELSRFLTEAVTAARKREKVSGW